MSPQHTKSVRHIISHLNADMLVFPLCCHTSKPYLLLMQKKAKLSL